MSTKKVSPKKADKKPAKKATKKVAKKASVKKSTKKTVKASKKTKKVKTPVAVTPTDVMVVPVVSSTGVVTMNLVGSDKSN